MGHFHALAAAACCRFDDDRIADLFADFERVFQRWHATVRTRHARHAESFHRILGANLVAHDADVFGCGADEGDVVVFAGLNESCVFRQEAVARMDRLCASDFAGREDRGKLR